MLSQINTKLETFNTISLVEMDQVALMNRTDTKYVFSVETLVEVLDELKEHYYTLEIGGKRTANYRTLYFDTKDNKLFIAHQNGKLNRYKIRVREYVDSCLSFLEIKFKSNKGRTIKKRIPLESFETELSSESRAFIDSNSNLDAYHLEPMLWNFFNRITLVSKRNKERLTIDIDLSFQKQDLKKELNFLVIAEVKREGNSFSDFMRIIKEKHIRPTGMSKYCIGSILSNKTLKYNNFKSKLLEIKKLEYAKSA